MKAPRATSITRLTEPSRTLIHRFTFLMLTLAAFALLVLGKADIVLIERMRISVSDATAPILAFMAEPAAHVARALEDADEMMRLREENARLKAENDRLLRWERVAHELAAENESLRALANAVPEQPARYVTARVIANVGGAFVRSILVNAGRRDGIDRNQAAINAQGLAGRVAEIGDRHARILLVTDLNSRIPVLVGRSRARAILAGDNTDKPRVQFLPANARVEPGDRIVTSGHGGVFPRGLPIGTIEAVADGSARVRPFADLDRLDLLQIVDFAIVGPEAIDEALLKQRAGR